MKTNKVILGLVICFFLTGLAVQGVVKASDRDNNDTIPPPDLKNTKINLSLRKEGENVVVTGSLRTENENLPLKGEKITIHRLEKVENILLGNALTDNNGRFEFSFDALEKKGIYLYKASFVGRENYNGSKSSPVYLNLLDMDYLILVSTLPSFAMLGVVGYILLRGIDPSAYFIPLMIGAVLGVILMFLFQIIGLIVGGAIIGYYISKNLESWKDHLKVGIVAGLFTFLVRRMLSIPTMLVDPSTITELYSVPQTTLLQTLLIQSIYFDVIFAAIMGLSSIIGGLLRRVISK